MRPDKAVSGSRAASLVRAADPGLVVVFLIGILATWPFLTRAGLPTLTDAQHHIYRTFELINAWRAGVVYLRWAPDLYYGFGYPIFNFYAPLAYYVSAAYGWFLGPVAGVKFALVLSGFLGALGMYRLVRERLQPLPAIASAAAFALAPYLAYVNPHARGALPESLAVALMPWVLAAMARLVHRPGPSELAAAALLLALSLLSHNLLAWVTAVWSLLWVAWETITVPAAGERHVRWKALARPATAFGLGLALAAFFWLPAIGEIGAVQFKNAFLPNTNYQLVPAAELFGLARLADLSSPDLGHFVFRLGLPQWLLAAFGLISAADPRTRAWRPTLVFFGLAGAACVCFTLPAAADAWIGLPGLAYLQFPWRLLGPSALALAVLAGGAVQWASVRLRAAWATALGLAALGACALAALPVLDPLPWPDPGPVTFRQMFALERSGAWGVGTTHAGEFLPLSVRTTPVPDEALLASYAVQAPEKLDRTSLPAGAEVSWVAHGPLSDELEVAAPAGFTLRVLTFDFPGWTAFVDGTPVPIAPADPQGFITLPVPAGTHTVTVRLVDTPLRQLGWGVSAAGFAGLAAIAIGLRRRAPARPPSRPAPAGAVPAATAGAGVLLVGAALALRVVGDLSSPWLSSSGDVTAHPGAQYPQVALLEDNVALVGFDLPQNTAAAGDQVPLTLYWQATGRVAADLSVFVHLFGSDGRVWGQSDKYVPVPFFPTGRWPAGRLMADPHLVNLSLEAPAGIYTLTAGMWQRDTGRRSRLIDPGDGPADSILLTTTFRVQP